VRGWGVLSSDPGSRSLPADWREEELAEAEALIERCVRHAKLRVGG
jgi:hypothetical protein